MASLGSGKTTQTGVGAVLRPKSAGSLRIPAAPFERLARVQAHVGRKGAQKNRETDAGHSLGIGTRILPRPAQVVKSASGLTY